MSHPSEQRDQHNFAALRDERSQSQPPVRGWSLPTPSGSPAVSIASRGPVPADPLKPYDDTLREIARLTLILFVLGLAVWGCAKAGRAVGTSKVESPTPTITEARKDVHDAATAIKRGADDSQEAVEAGRKSWLAYLAELTALGIESVQTSPHVPVVTKSYDDIEAANKRIVAETVKLRFVEGKLDEARRQSEAQGKQIVTLSGEVKTLTKERDKAIEAKESAFHKWMVAIAVIANVLGVACIGIGIWLALPPPLGASNIKGGAFCWVLGVCLIGGGCAIAWIDNHQTEVLIFVAVSASLAIGYLVWSRVKREKAERALKIVVPEIDAADPTGTGIKAQLGKAAGKFARGFKHTITGIKNQINPTPEAA